MKRHMKSISQDEAKHTRKSAPPPRSSLAVKSPRLIQYLESLDRAVKQQVKSGKKRGE